MMWLKVLTKVVVEFASTGNVRSTFNFMNSDTAVKPVPKVKQKLHKFRIFKPHRTEYSEILHLRNYFLEMTITSYAMRSFLF